MGSTSSTPVNRFGRYVLTTLSFALLYAFAFWFGVTFRVPEGVSPFWPAAGVLLAWFWVYGLSHFPGAVLANVAMLLWNQDVLNVQGAIETSLVFAGGYALAGSLLRKYLPATKWWLSFRELILFAAIVVPTSLLLGIFATFDYVPGPNEAQSYRYIVGLEFGLGDFIGCLMCGPFIAFYLGEWLNRGQKRNAFDIYRVRTLTLANSVEVLAQVATILVCSYFAFARQDIFRNNAEHILFIPLLWIVLRGGIRGAVWGGFLVCIACSLTVHFLNLPPERLGSLQVFLITILLSAFGLGVVLSSRDKAQFELETSERKYQLVAEAVNDAIWEFDTRGKQIFFTESLKVLLGHPGMDSIQPIAWFEERLFPEDRDRVLKAIEAHILDNVPYNLEYRLMHGSGEYRWYLAFGQVQRDRRGNAPKMVGALNDISERKQSEAKIQQLNSDLEKRVQERTAELQSANDELASFSYSVSHDLRSPLRSINGFAKLLGDEYGEHLTGDGTMYLERIRAASVRMSNLIDDLLQLSRMGKFEPRLTRTNITSIASGILDDLTIHNPQRKVTITVAQDLLAMADTVLVRNLLENLIQNAWKFTSQRSNTQIEIGQTIENGERTFYIRDNGVGFDTKYSSKLFMPFERLHNDPTYQGSGIGLASVAKIVYLHGGRVWAESEVDKGSTFYFTLGEANQATESGVA